MPRKNYFEEPGEHADELETSVMMYYHPEFVNLSDAGPGQSKSFAVQSLNEKVAWIPRNWQKVTEDTGIGNPMKSTAKKGEAFAKAVVEKYATLLIDLAKNSTHAINQKTKLPFYHLTFSNGVFVFGEY